jgi:small subunit ribosomal protein S7
MVDGKKASSEIAVYKAMEDSAKKLKIEDPLQVLDEAMKNVFPTVEVKGRRVGGANYQIPFPVEGHRRTHLGMMWFVQSARARKGMPFWKRLSAEIVDAHNSAGAAVKKKEDTHKMAEANLAFAHFARF